MLRVYKLNNCSVEHLMDVIKFAQDKKFSPASNFCLTKKEKGK